MEEEASDLDIITLNVGGDTSVSVMRGTLTQAEDSLLASMFRGCWSLVKDSEGRYFIDQSPRLFLPLIDYLRSIRDETPGLRAQPPKKLGTAFDIMVEHYNLTLFVYRLELRILTTPVPTKATITNVFAGQWSVDSPFEWITFDLDRIAHQRKIKSYTVVMGKYTNARIGWRDSSKEFPADGEEQNMIQPTNPAKGVGDYDGSIAIDCVCTEGGSHFDVFVDGGVGTHETDGGYDSPLPLEYAPPHEYEGVAIREGSEIECLATVPSNVALYPGRPTWRVDSRFIESFVCYEWKPVGDAIPCISIKGKVRISNIVYD